MNQRKFAIWFFILTIIASAGIIAWTFVLNKGTLSIAGKTPFVFHVSSVKNRTCETSPCAVTLRPGKYMLRAEKDGYKEAIQEITVSLRKTSLANIDFRFIPTLTKQGNFSLPSKLKNIPNNFTGITVSDALVALLTKIPNDAKSVSFSPNGKYALVALGKELFIAGIKDNKPYLEKSTVAGDGIAVLTNADIITLERTEDYQTVYATPLESGVKRVITVFKRPLTDVEIRVSPNGSKVLFIEQSPTDKTGYMVDVNAKSRQKLVLPPVFSDIQFVDNLNLIYKTITFDQADGVERERFFFVDAKTNGITELPLLNLNAAVPQHDDYVFAGTIDYSPDDASQSTISFKSILEKTPSLEELLGTGTQFAYITVWNPSSDKKTALAEVPISNIATLMRLEYSTDKKLLLITIGDTVYALSMEEQNGS